MHTSTMGLNVIRSFEGRALRAYQDSVGVWTIGYGNTNYDANAVKQLGKIKAGLSITADQAEHLFVESIQGGYEPAVNKRLGPSVTQGAFDAGASFHYNCGAIAKASWPGALLKGDMAACRSGIMAWNKAGGSVLAGLTRRRNREWLMISRQDYGPEGRQGPVEIGANGRPTGKQLPAPLGSPASPSTAPAPLPTPESTSSAVPGIIYPGQSGPQVRAASDLLVKLGRLASVRDTYDEIMVAAVEKFQGEHPNLTKDGRIGPATMAQFERDVKMRRSVKKTGTATVVITGAGSALAGAGLVALKVVLIAGGTVAIAGLIYVAIKHRTELVTLWNKVRGNVVP